MALIIDTYNVLHCTHILSGSDALMDTDRLCALLGDSRWAGQRIVVVCDGAPPPLADHESAVVELVYVGPGKDADSWIERFIEKTDAPRDLTVVSNDHRIVRAARRRRCHTMGSETFLRQLVRKPAQPAGPDKPAGLGPDEAEQWLKTFGYDRPAEPEDSATPTPPDADAPADRHEASGDGTDYWLREFGFGEEDESRS